jgi:hypothetical protein
LKHIGDCDDDIKGIRGGEAVLLNERERSVVSANRSPDRGVRLKRGPTVGVHRLANQICPAAFSGTLLPFSELLSGF